MNRRAFSIVGLGWLGQSIAQIAVQRDLSVYGTVRSIEKAELLSKQLSSKVISFDCYAPFPVTEQKGFFKNRIVVICIAAGRSKIEAEKYVAAISQLVRLAVESGAHKVIFISTTSVFGNLTGIIHNSTPPSPVTESGKAHALIESFIEKSFSEKCVILRLAGLLGPNPDTGYRHPIFSLSRRGKVTASNQPVNLVHKTDVINAIFAIAEQESVSGTMNLCSQQHPTKSEYYGWCAKQLGLAIPTFEPSDSEGRRIDATETYKLLNVSLEYKSPFDMLPDYRKPKVFQRHCIDKNCE